MKRRSHVPGFPELKGKIFLLRGRRAMVDRDLAKLYGVTTGNLNKSVRRNLDRFPDDFMFRLTPDESESLIFQSGISSEHGGSRHLPYAFTQEGIAMLSSILKSRRAVQVNIQIMRTFIKMRELMRDGSVMDGRVEEVESRLGAHETQILQIIESLRELMLAHGEKEEPERREIGFHMHEKPAPYRVGRKPARKPKK